MHDPFLRINVKDIQSVERVLYDHKINLKQSSQIYNFVIQVNIINIVEIQTTK